MYRYIILFMCAAIGLLSLAVADPLTIPYPYTLVTDHHAFTGRVPADAAPGARVLAEVDEKLPAEGHGEAETPVTGELVYLRIAFSKNEATNKPHGSHTSTLIMSTGKPTRKTTQDTTHVPTQTLPHTGKSSTGTPSGTAAPATASDTGDAESREMLHEIPDPINVMANFDATGGDQSGFVVPSDNQPLPHVEVLHARKSLPYPHHSSVHLTHHLFHHLAPPDEHDISKRADVTNFGDNVIKTDGDVRNIDENVFRFSPERISVIRQRRAARRKKRFAGEPEADFIPVMVTQPTSEKLVFILDGSTAFTVDADRYIVVNDTEELAKHEFIPFNLYLAAENGTTLSNPIAFLIHIDHPSEASESYPTGPAVFAGVLVLCVVFLALLIPLVTRAKRRYKQGKPMFKMGSHPSSAQLESQVSMSRKQSEPNWYGNNAFYNYEEEVEREKSDFTKGLRNYSTKSEPARRVPNKEPLSEKSSSSGVDVSSQYGADGNPDDSYVQRL